MKLEMFGENGRNRKVRLLRGYDSGASGTSRALTPGKTSLEQYPQKDGRLLW